MRSCGNIVSGIAVTFAFNCWETLRLGSQTNTSKCTNAGSLKRAEGTRGEQLQLIEPFRLQETLGIILTPNCVCLTGDSEPVPPSSSLPGLSSFMLFLYGLAIQYAFLRQHFVSSTHHTNVSIFLPHITVSEVFWQFILNMDLSSDPLHPPNATFSTNKKAATSIWR